MRISDGSSDVCSSDLQTPPYSQIPTHYLLIIRRWITPSTSPTALPCIRMPARSARCSRKPRPDQPRAVLRCFGLDFSALHRITRPKPANHSVRSEEHTSELQSLMRNSYAVFCLKKKNKTHK